MTEHDTFDQQIRSMLAHAEEPVPSGVWNAVSGALDARARRGAWLVVFRRAAIGVAAAAAILVAGVFLFRDREVAKTAEAPLTALAETPEMETEIPVVELVEEPISAAQEAGLLAAATPKRRPAVRQVAVPVEVPVAAAVEPMEPVEEPAMEKTIMEPEAVVVKEEPAAEAPVAEDFFDLNHPEAGLDSELQQPAFHRLSFGAGGDVQSNASPSRSVFTGYRSSAAIPTHTTIAEHGDDSDYGIPLSFGANIQWQFSQHWALGTGLTYSYLCRSFNGTYTEVANGAVTRTVTSEIENGLHYVGIPVNLYYIVGNDRTVRFYGFGGANFEKGVSNRFRIKDADGDILYHEKVDGLQVSLGLGLGVVFQLSDHVGLYLDPSLRYYLENGQPKSIRTAQPLMMSLEAGLRFNL